MLSANFQVPIALVVQIVEAALVGVVLVLGQSWPSLASVDCHWTLVVRSSVAALVDIALD